MTGETVSGMPAESSGGETVDESWREGMVDEIKGSTARAGKDGNGHSDGCGAVARRHTILTVGWIVGQVDGRWLEFGGKGALGSR